RPTAGAGQPLVLVGVRQQREVARSLDRGRKLALVGCACPGDTARDDLAGLRDICLERREILVVDLIDAFRREPAEFLAAKITCHVKSPRSRARSGFLGLRGALVAAAFRRSAAALLVGIAASTALVGIAASAAALVRVAAATAVIGVA